MITIRNSTSGYYNTKKKFLFSIKELIVISFILSIYLSENIRN